METNKVVDVCQKFDVHAEKCIRTTFIGARISDERKWGQTRLKNTLASLAPNIKRV
jgi:hypothetical protein